MIEEKLGKLGFNPYLDNNKNPTSTNGKSKAFKNYNDKPVIPAKLLKSLL